MKTMNGKGELSLSILDRFREMTDNEIIFEVTRKEVHDGERYGGYRLEMFLDQLSPRGREIAAATMELYRRKFADVHSDERIRQSEDIYKIFRPKLEGLESEEFWVLGLNQSLKPIGLKRISVGGLTQTVADVRIIFFELIKMKAVGFVLAHNHPSGNVTPSREDKRLTSLVSKAAETMNIKLIDHVIIGAGDFYSFSDNGEI
jgi:DNA repair protein RadC